MCYNQNMKRPFQNLILEDTLNESDKKYYIADDLRVSRGDAFSDRVREHDGRRKREHISTKRQHI